MPCNPSDVAQVHESQAMTPTVSVVVTTYNQAAYIADTLASVARQTLRPAEIIVIDDGSTDSTPERIAEFRDRVTYVRQRNQGVAAARNAGVEAARGDLIALLDGDDLWDDRKLEEQVQAFAAYPQSGLVAGDVCHFSSEGVLLPAHLKRYVLNDSDAPIESGRYFSTFLKECIISTTSQVMIPAAVLRDVGPSDTRFSLASDYDLYLRIAARYPITLVNRVLTSWRILDSSASGPRSGREFRWSAEMMAVLRKQSKELPIELRPETYASWRSRLVSVAHRAYYHVGDSDRLWATRYLLRLAWANPEAPWVAAYAAALWVPIRLRRALAPSIRNTTGIR
jgi:glycosyltransferase involved in cell wall biosynthesis